jgi:hypothetical protein
VVRGVEVGARIRVEASFHDYEVSYRCAATVPAPGPGRVASLALPLGEELVIVTGTFVGSTSVRALRDVSVMQTGDWNRRRYAPVPVGPDGRFAVVIPRPDEGVVTPLRVCGRDAAGRLHDAHASLPAPPPGDRLEIGRLEIGVVAMSLVPELTRGRLVDLRGLPVAGASVGVEIDSVEDVVAAARTDDDGAFVVYAHPPLEALRLLIRLEGDRPRDVEAVADQVIVIEPSTEEWADSKR